VGRGRGGRVTAGAEDAVLARGGLGDGLVVDGLRGGVAAGAEEAVTAGFWWWWGRFADGFR